MRFTAFVLALCLVCSCSGGGSNPKAEAESEPVTEEGLSLEQTLQVLQNCSLSELEGLLDLVTLLQSALDPEAEAPEFQVTGFDLAKARVNWAVDLDQDDTNDLTGTIGFEDGNGNPTLPLNILDLLSGELDLASLLGAFQDGTVVILDFTAQRGVTTTGTIAFTLEGGAPSDLTGSVVVHGTNCVITLAFGALEIDPALGSYPSGAADVTVESGDLTLEGTLMFDGTSVVTIDVPPFAFEYDILTGQMKAVND